MQEVAGLATKELKGAANATADDEFAAILAELEAPKAVATAGESKKGKKKVGKPGDSQEDVDAVLAELGMVLQPYMCCLCSLSKIRGFLRVNQLSQSEFPTYCKLVAKLCSLLSDSGLK